MQNSNHLEDNILEKLKSSLFLLKNPIVLVAFISTFIGALFWIIALTKFELSRAYPLMSLSIVIVVFLSDFYLGERVSLLRYGGLILLFIGASLIVQK